jgi:hypothetical protein
MLIVGISNLVIAFKSGDENVHTRADLWIVGSMIIGALS